MVSCCSSLLEDGLSTRNQYFELRHGFIQYILRRSKRDDNWHIHVLTVQDCGRLPPLLDYRNLVERAGEWLTIKQLRYSRRSARTPCYLSMWRLLPAEIRLLDEMFKVPFEDWLRISTLLLFRSTALDIWAYCIEGADILLDFLAAIWTIRLRCRMIIARLKRLSSR